MSTPLENLPPWVLETGWIVLAMATHAGLLGAMPALPMSHGNSPDLDTVSVAIVDIRPGNLAMYYPEANAIVPRRLDPASKTPAFKSVAARIERA